MHDLRPDLRTGEPRIDADHAELLKLVAQFREMACTDALTPDYLRAVLAALIDYCVMHFRREETFMEEMHFPELHEHKREHYQLWHACLDLTEACEATDYDPVCGVRISTLILTWLANHIECWDKALARYIREEPFRVARHDIDG